MPKKGNQIEGKTVLNKKKLPEKQEAFIPEKRLELLSLAAADFESAMYTIPSLRRVKQIYQKE